MSRFQVDPALKEAISSNGQQLELCDESGRVIGYVISPTEMRKVELNRQSLAAIYAKADETFDADAYRRALADPRKYSTEEVIKKLGLE